MRGSEDSVLRLRLRLWGAWLYVLEQALAQQEHQIEAMRKAELLTRSASATFNKLQHEDTTRGFSYETMKSGSATRAEKCCGDSNHSFAHLHIETVEKGIYTILQAEAKVQTCAVARPSCTAHTSHEARI